MSTSLASRGERPGPWRISILAACLLYFALQALYVTRLPLVMDEFQGAAAIHRLAESVPYRDFHPYKTVVGYYLQLPVLLAAQRPWEALIAVKLEMALLTAVVLGAVSLSLGRLFDRRAVALGLALLLVMSTFAERSSELRVDMPTALAGLVSLVLLLRGRAGWAGLAAGLAFLVSQKGVYYLLAGNAALAAVWLLTGRHRRHLGAALAFNATAGAGLLAYLAGWSLVSSVDDVVQATFLSHGDIALAQLYDNRLKYWSQTLRRNPFFYLMAVVALGRLAAGRPGAVGRRVRVALGAYGATLLVLGLVHRQPWPYFFVLLIPTLWILVIALLASELEVWPRCSRLYRRTAVAALVGLGFLWPASRLPVVLGRDNGYQRATVQLADRLLESGGTYLAGTELLFDRRQGEPRLAWLDIPTNRALGARPPHELESLRRDLAADPPKFVVNNYRIYGLPRLLRAHLARTYEPWWGSIAIYSPTFEPGEHRASLGFAGSYEVVAPAAAAVRVDERSLAAGDRVELAAGEHTVVTDRPLRLRYVPASVEGHLDPRYRRSELLFPQVYTY